MSFWRKWWVKKRRSQERKILEKRGLWGMTPETVQWLIEEVSTVDLENIGYDRRISINLNTYHPNIDVLVVQINLMVAAIVGQEYVPHPGTDIKLVRTLDEYLVTVSNVPISPQNALKVLIPPTEHLVSDLLLMRSEEHEMLGYYMRRSEKLINDIVVFLTVIASCQEN